MTPPSCFDVVGSEPDHVKVRLLFNTWEPKHIHSHFLKTEASAAPPFVESVCVLVPLEQAFHRLSAYRDIFRALICAGVLAKADTLTAFEIREEDTHTLAYRELEL